MVEYDPETALIVVDAQNDFADPKGSLYVPGGEEAVEAMNEEIRRAKAAGSLVVYTLDWHPETTPHFQKDGGTWPVHCVHDTWGAELYPGLEVVDGPMVKKGTGGEDGYSGFSMRHAQTGEHVPTELEDILREKGIKKVVVVGLATDYCVRDTVLDAIRLGFDATVIRAGIRAVDLAPGDGEKAIALMQEAGAHIE